MPEVWVGNPERDIGLRLGKTICEVSWGLPGIRKEYLFSRSNSGDLLAHPQHTRVEEDTSK